MVEEIKYCTCVMKSNFKKELLMIRDDNEYFESPSKCSIFDNDFVEGNVRVRDHCLATVKCKGTAHRDCNDNVSLNYKISIVIHILKKYDVHLGYWKNRTTDPQAGPRIPDPWTEPHTLK